MPIVENIEAEHFLSIYTWKKNLIKLYFSISEDKGNDG